jgi:predicted DNA-binding ribbon-helix-helix protein
MAIPLARPGSGLVKRSIAIQGHRTSVALEPAFWDALDAAAAAMGISSAALVTRIDEERTTPLASAIRVWLFRRAGAA